MSMRQKADFPVILDEIVTDLQYKPGWQFHLADFDRGQGSVGLTFVIVPMTTNSYHREDTEYQVSHYFPVIPAAYDYRSWRRWVLDRIVEVEAHEACEFFILEGERPYAPSHGHGNNPYMIREVGTDTDQRTSFRNEVKNESL